MSFPCTGCGACCRSITGIPELAKWLQADGSCMHLVGVRCAIYENRPKVCRVDEMRPEVINQAEWYRRNEDACERLHLQVYGAPMRTP